VIVPDPSELSDRARVGWLVAASLVLGAVIGAWRGGARRPAPRPAPDDEPAFARPAVHQRAAPLSARLLDGFQKAARPLPDDLFADDASDGQPAFADIAGPLTSPDTRFRALGTPDGSFVWNRTQGWHAFREQRWARVARATVPEAVRRRWPDADPRALVHAEASRDGDVEAR